MATCDALMAQTCTLSGCHNNRLVHPAASGDTSWCWPKTFIAQHPLAADRTGAAFLPALRAFYSANTTDPQVRPNIGLIDGRLKYAAIVVRSTLLQFQPNAKTEPVVHAFTDFRDQRTASAPAGLKSMVHSGGVFWTWTFTEDQLVTNVFVGFAICFPSAFVVLLLSTRNIVVSSIAIVA